MLLARRSAVRQWRMTMVATDLEWIDSRWHLDGRPIQAGCGMEVQWPDGTWQHVRIESMNGGQRLNAHFDYHGLGLRVRVVQLGASNDEGLPLRWPTS